MVKSTMSPGSDQLTLPPLARNSWTMLSLNVLRVSASFMNFSVSSSLIRLSTLVPRNLFRWRQRPQRGQQPLGDHLGTRVEGPEQAAILMVRHLAVRTGLGLTANLTLGMLDREGPARVTVLAAAASIGQPAMTELVQRLEWQGLVTRVEDPGDGRVALVTVSNDGRARLDDQQRGRRDRMAELLTALPAEDEITLTLAMHVALPIIRRLIDDAQQSRTQADSGTPISQSRT